MGDPSVGPETKRDKMLRPCDAPTRPDLERRHRRRRKQEVRSLWGRKAMAMEDKEDDGGSGGEWEGVGCNRHTHSLNK